MAGPSVTYSFSNSTTADATQVNQNFTDLISGMTDGTKDFSINALTCAGAATLNGNVTLGNSSSDDLTVTASLASSIPIKTTNTYDLGSATIGIRSIYFGSSGGAFTTRLIGGAAGASYTITLPTAVPSVDKSVMTFNTSATASFEHRSVVTTVSKTNSDSPYTVLASDQVIFCSAASGAITVNLPAAASSSGKTLIIKRTDSTVANVITIDGNASETIDGATTTTLNTQYEGIKLVCDGSNWHVLDREIPTEWTSFSPTLSNVTEGSGVSKRFRFRRVRDAMEIVGCVVLGTGGDVTGTVVIPLPTGYSVDLAKTAGTSGAGGYAHVGCAKAYDASTSNSYVGVVYLNNTANSLVVVSHSATVNWANTAPFDWTVSDEMHIVASVPISGWKG